MRKTSIRVALLRDNEIVRFPTHLLDAFTRRIPEPLFTDYAGETLYLIVASVELEGGRVAHVGHVTGYIERVALDGRPEDVDCADETEAAPPEFVDELFEVKAGEVFPLGERQGGTWEIPEFIARTAHRLFLAEDTRERMPILRAV